MTERMTNVLAALRLEPQALPGILVPLALCTAVLELLAPRLKSDLGIQAAAPVQALIIVVAVLIAMVARELSGGVLDPVYDRLYGTERAVAPRGDYLLKTEMGAGHSGPSGRYDAWKEEAFIAAWILDRLGLR